MSLEAAALMPTWAATVSSLPMMRSANPSRERTTRIAESKARLEREAQAVAKLKHENILEIFAYSGRESAESYIVTEFIDGTTLKHGTQQQAAELLNSELEKRAKVVKATGAKAD